MSQTWYWPTCGLGYGSRGIKVGASLLAGVLDPAMKSCVSVVVLRLILDHWLAELGPRLSDSSCFFTIQDQQVGLTQASYRLCFCPGPWSVWSFACNPKEWSLFFPQHSGTSESKPCWLSKPDISRACLSGVGPQDEKPNVVLRLVSWVEPLQLWLVSHLWVSQLEVWVLTTPWLFSSYTFHGFLFIPLVVKYLFC